MHKPHMELSRLVAAVGADSRTKMEHLFVFKYNLNIISRIKFRKEKNMSKLKQEAVQLIENMQEDLMTQVVFYLKNLKNMESEKNETARNMEGLQTLLSFAGTLPQSFHYKKELEEAREEKYDNFY